MVRACKESDGQGVLAARIACSHQQHCRHTVALDTNTEKGDDKCTVGLLGSTCLWKYLDTAELDTNTGGGY